MGSLENRVRAAVLSRCRKGRARPPKPVAGIQHMRDRTRSATTARSVTIASSRQGSKNSTYDCRLSARPFVSSVTISGARQAKISAVFRHIKVRFCRDGLTIVVIFIDEWKLPRGEKFLKTVFTRHILQTLYELLGALADDDADRLRAAFRKAAKATIPTTIPAIPMLRRGSGGSSAPMPFSVTSGSERPMTRCWPRHTSDEL